MTTTDQERHWGGAQGSAYTTRQRLTIEARNVVLCVQQPGASAAV